MDIIMFLLGMFISLFIVYKIALNMEDRDLED